MKKFYFLLFFIYLTIHAFSQDPFFKYYQVDRSEQNLRIQKLYQDKTGFVWLGTSSGLYKFNGISFLKFKMDTAMSGQTISAIYEDKDGKVWIGYNSGLIGHVHKDSIVILQTVADRITDPVTDITEDENGSIWISTYGSGIYILNDERITTLNTESGLSDNFVYALFKNSDNLIYAGTDRGISICNTNDHNMQITVLSSVDGLPDNIVQEIASDNNGNLWIGMQDAGVCLFDVSAKTFHQSDVLKTWNYGSVTSIVVSHEELWIGTANNGIVDYEFKGDLRFRAFNRSTGHAFSRINDMLKSFEGNIFIASGSELIQSSGERLEFLYSIDNNSIDNVRAVLADKNRNIWFSTNEGLFQYIMHGVNKPHLIKHFENTRYSEFQYISLYEDCFGRIWAGTYDNGVIILDPQTKQIKNLTAKDGIINENVFSISGFDCEVWMATLGGVSRVQLSNNTLFAPENYNKTHGLANNYIYYVFTDSKQREWFATDGQGITVLEGGEFTNYSTADGLKGDVIYSITEDMYGNIWFSTSNEGIYKFDGSSFTNYSLNEGIRDKSIYGLSSDQQGNIVIVHKKGIDLLNVNTGKVTSLGVEAGVIDLNPDLNAISRDTKGNIWIGTQRGLIKYAGYFPDKTHKPVTHINDVLLFLKSTDKNVFSSNENHITIEYIGLWYTNPELILYQYILEGYSRDWVSTRDHSVTFPNLSPGDYTFKVRSTIDGQFEDAAIQEISFTIKKPFYATLWFILLVLITAAGVTLFVIRYREQKVKEREYIQKERIRFQFETLKSQVNPHFLFNSFNTLINIIEENKDLAVEYVERLSAFFRNIVKYREQELVPLIEEFSLIENYLFLQKKRYGENLNMCIEDVAEKNKFCIPPLTLQLLIENAIKHNAISRDKKLFIKIYRENGYLVIENNINIKKNTEASTGFGLQNIINRYRLLNARDVKIDHTEDFFKVHLPLIYC